MDDNRAWWVNRFYNALKRLAEPYKDIDPAKEETDHIVGHIGMNVTPRQAMIIVHVLEREVDRTNKGRTMEYKTAPDDMHCPKCQRWIAAAEFEAVEDEGDGFTWFCMCGVCDCEVGQ